MPVNAERVVGSPLQTSQLAAELGSLESFLEAAQTLLAAIDNLSAEDIKRCNRKIVALAEVARSTLGAAGIKLYSFASCSPCRAPFKEIYFDLLRALSAKRDTISTDPDIKARLNKLLLPLSEGFVIQRRIAPTKRKDFPLDLPPSGHAATLPPRHASKVKCAARSDTTTSRCNATPTTSLMPPPDAFPPSGRNGGGLSYQRKNQGSLRPLPKPRIRMFEPVAEEEYEHDTDSGSDDDGEDEQDTEDEPVIPPFARLRPHRFGIFCTPNRSIHQRDPYPSTERSGRSRAVRPVRTE